MIAIVNITPDPQPSGWHDYELRINTKVIAQFQHRREESLAVCLRRAADAAEKAEYELISALLAEAKRR